MNLLDEQFDIKFIGKTKDGVCINLNNKDTEVVKFALRYFADRCENEKLTDAADTIYQVICNAQAIEIK